MYIYIHINLLYQAHATWVFSGMHQIVHRFYHIQDQSNTLKQLKLISIHQGHWYKEP